tara:strand:- start:4 stop:156 length:153 start_codon:yes stop_codon:yes gene_type:complete
MLEKLEVRNSLTKFSAVIFGFSASRPSNDYMSNLKEKINQTSFYVNRKSD